MPSASSRFNTRDYYAFQELWSECSHLYIRAVAEGNSVQQVKIMNTFRDSLVDVGNGKRALRTVYEKWETEEWQTLCNSLLEQWAKDNPFEANNRASIEDEEARIQQEYNFMRYRMILQVIQDSGIGLGTKSGMGYYVGPRDKEKFTGES